MKFLKKSDGKKKMYYGTASLVKKIGDESSKKYVIITSAHNFTMTEIGRDNEVE